MGFYDISSLAPHVRCGIHKVRIFTHETVQSHIRSLTWRCSEQCDEGAPGCVQDPWLAVFATEDGACEGKVFLVKTSLILHVDL